jgi:hypothetical protein
VKKVHIDISTLVGLLKGESLVVGPSQISLEGVEIRLTPEDRPQDESEATELIQHWWDE